MSMKLKESFHAIKMLPNAVLVYAILMILLSITDRVFGSLYIVDMTKNGMTVESMGIIASLALTIMTLVDFPSGVLADIHGRTKVLAIGLAVWSLGLLLFGLSRTFLGFAISMAVWAAGIGTVGGLPQTWIVDALGDTGRADDKEVVLPYVSSVSQISGAIAAGASTVVVGLGMAWLFGAQALLAVIACFVAIFGMMENYGAKTRTHVAVGKIIKVLTETSKMRLVVLRAMVSSGTLSLFLTFWQVYLLRQLHASSRLVGPLVG
ncbi:MAG: hypothetical protein C7B47_06115 [Sulfobacillus thermosulfidooxidans]|uniref:Major facilitator superfamily (MFS) profile domain-containing protein n=1 Tax=Sulfobacillus thermosulfidooxidans TaxID=28034 RepID=A0A2T2X1B2_SULTH|nr:MAG: hypothetical protein C7B47_06115 [Sulfobacillus thermosulfidooxidans]